MFVPVVKKCKNRFFIVDNEKSRTPEPLNPEPE